MRLVLLVATSLGGAVAARSIAGAQSQPTPRGEWQAYGRDAGGSRYAPLAQITREDVGRLAVA